MAFDFSEEQINEMYGMYREVLEKIHQETGKVAEELAGLAEKLRYKPVIELSKDVADYYSNTLKDAENRAMQDWKDSEASFSNVMKKMNAGDSAEGRSRTLEDQIEGEISSWKGMDAGRFNGIDTTNWKCDVSDFEEIQNCINRFVSSLESMQGQYAGKLNNKTGENEIYVSIQPVVLQSIAIVKEGFQSGTAESFRDLAQEFNERARAVSSLGTNAAQAAASRSQQFVSSGAAELKNKVKTIMN